MDDLEYKKQILDTKSASFCGAKWYNATIWLGSGMTTSCHHPLPHKIDLEEIKKNPSAIHNTKQKKENILNLILINITIQKNQSIDKYLHQIFFQHLLSQYVKN